jgi:LuxR family maltose regulon positive regulatory protein
LQKAVALCKHSQNDEFLVGCWLLSLRLRIAQGDLSGAEQVLEQAIRMVRTGRIPAPMAKRVDVARVYLILEKGKTIREGEGKLIEQVDCHPFYRFLGVTKSRILPEVEARNYLDELSQVAQTNEWVYGLVAIRALQASFAKTQVAALEYLIDGLQLAKSGGFIRTFLDVGEKLKTPLREIARRGDLSGDTRQILAALTEGETSDEGLVSLIEPLSERELEVLGLVAAGMSNREIAEKLIISTGTAKSHIHHLCGKLGVRNRTEAAMKARELGLL